jgi:excisionase family DNA binding protein
MAKDDWITTAEAVTLSGYHVDHLRELAREGKIKAQKWGREWQISRASLLDHIRRVEKMGAKRGPKPKA